MDGSSTKKKKLFLKKFLKKKLWILSKKEGKLHLHEKSKMKPLIPVKNATFFRHQHQFIWKKSFKFLWKLHFPGKKWNRAIYQDFVLHFYSSQWLNVGRLCNNFHSEVEKTWNFYLHQLYWPNKIHKHTVVCYNLMPKLIALCLEQQRRKKPKFRNKIVKVSSKCNSLILVRVRAQASTIKRKYGKQQQQQHRDIFIIFPIIIVQNSFIFAWLHVCPSNP